jgi:hypothetical protein
MRFGSASGQVIGIDHDNKEPEEYYVQSSDIRKCICAV